MSQFVDSAIEKLKEDGYKTTPRRTYILEIFDQDIIRYFNAKEIQARVAEKYPRMSFDTIYRNLKLFTLYNILEEAEMEGEMVFRKHDDPIKEHHHHFVCVNCGKIVPVHEYPLDFYQDQLPEGYVIKNHEFRLEGLCDVCHAKLEIETE